MACEDKCIDESDDVFMDALEEKNNFIKEIIQLKIHLEEALKKQILEKEKHNEKLKLEIISLRKELEKKKV